MPRIDGSKFDEWCAQRIEASLRELAILAMAGEVSEEQAVAERLHREARARALRETPPHRGEWVNIKRTLSYGEVQDARSARLKRDENGLLVPDEAGERIALMAAAVTAWTRCDEDGEPILPTAKAMRDLDEYYGEWLFGVIEDQRASYLRGPEEMDALKSGAAGGADAA